MVVHRPYNYGDAGLIVRKMTELLTLDLVNKNLIKNQIVLTIEYDVENLNNLEELLLIDMEEVYLNMPMEQLI